MSDYLTDGWKKDELSLVSVDLVPDKVTGIFRVKDYYMPSDDIFHLTVPLAFIWIAQLAIIFACWDHKLPKKSGEVFLREINIKCTRMINKTENILFELAPTKKNYHGNLVYYTGIINIENDAWVGEGKFIFPLPPEYVTGK
jgi:hypothetical protein